MTHINWNAELRKIKRDYDRDFDGILPERTNKQIASQPQLSERMSLVVIWAQLVLVAGLAVALFWWPYGHQCGLPLVGLLGSNAMVIVGGIALCVRSWQGRMPLVFSGSALAIVAAWTVIALHTVPRLGYAPAGGTAAAWYCPASR
jgi:hypothetical protein